MPEQIFFTVGLEWSVRPCASQSWIHASTVYVAEVCLQTSYQSGRRDLNPRPLDPQGRGRILICRSKPVPRTADGLGTCTLFALVMRVWSQIGPKIRSVRGLRGVP
jgi:hypothetical protein